MPCKITIRNSMCNSTNAQQLPRANRQPSFNPSPDCASASHKIGYSYNHSSSCLNRVRVSGSTATIPESYIELDSPGKGYATGAACYDPLTFQINRRGQLPDGVMGNVPSAKEQCDDESPDIPEVKERKVFHKRRKSAYLSSLLGVSTKPVRDEVTKVNKGLFGNLLRESSRDTGKYKTKRGRSKLKNFRYSDPSLNAFSLQQSANNCHMTRTSVPSSDITVGEKQLCADSAYANYDVKIGRSYNDRLYPFDQQNGQRAHAGGDDVSGKHVYENMDFYLQFKNPPKDAHNSAQGSFSNEQQIINELKLTQKDDVSTTQSHTTTLENDKPFQKYQSKKLSKNCSLGPLPYVDPKCVSDTSNSGNPLRYNNTNTPSLLDAINALGEEFGSDTDSSLKESDSSTSLASMGDTFRSGSIYFSINEESTRNDNLARDVPSYLVNAEPESNDCEEYSYFSFYADVHQSADQTSDCATYSDSTFLSTADLYRPSLHNFSDDLCCTLNDSVNSLYNSTNGDRMKVPCDFLYDTTFSSPQSFTIPFDHLFPRTKSESDVLSFSESEPLYENLFKSNLTEGESLPNSVSSRSSDSSGDYLLNDSEYEDATSKVSQPLRARFGGRSHRIGDMKQSKSPTIKQSLRKTELSASISALICNDKRPPQPPTRRPKDCGPLEDIYPPRSRLRIRSASFHRMPHKDEDSKKRPASFGTPNHQNTDDSKNGSLSQESICDESFHYTRSACADDHAPSTKWLAERKKADGNDKYSNQLYNEALVSYSKAIELCADCAAYYSNRSACYMMLGKYSEALADARESIRLDPEFVKGYLRVGKCNIALGDANAALSVLRHASDIDATKAVRDEITKAQTLYKCLEEINKFIAKKEYRTAVFHIEKALLHAVACQSLKINKAENLVFLQRFSEAETIVNDILQSDGTHPDAIYVRGLCLYYQDNQGAAITHFQHVLRLAPDHKKAKDAYKRAKALRTKKDAGNQAFSKSQWREALNLYTEAIAVDSTNAATLAKLYFNRATAGAKLNQFEQSVKDCTEAINRNEDYVKAYVRRALSHQVLESHEEAVRDFEKANRLSGGHEYDRQLRDAKIQLKRSKRKDYFKILGISRSASDDEIKKAYRKKALMHHPDRHSNASEKERRDHEVQFKEIGEAYAILTDPKKKSMYENGHDINDTDDFSNFSDGAFDPTEIFQAFFNNTGGTPYGASGHGRHHFNFGGGSPGFSFM